MRGPLRNLPLPFDAGDEPLPFASTHRAGDEPLPALECGKETAAMADSKPIGFANCGCPLVRVGGAAVAMCCTLGICAACPSKNPSPNPSSTPPAAAPKWQHKRGARHRALREVLGDGLWHEARDLERIGGRRFSNRIQEIRRGDDGGPVIVVTWRWNADKTDTQWRQQIAPRHLPAFQPELGEATP